MTLATRWPYSSIWSKWAVSLGPKVSSILYAFKFVFIYIAHLKTANMADQSAEQNTR